MTILTNFKKYIPEDEDKRELYESLSIGFIRSAEGIDWYDAQKYFAENKLKVVFFRETGEIFQVDKDITALWPVGASVADVDYDPNAKIDDFLGKVFNINTGKIEDKLYTEEELILQAQQKERSLYRTASSIISRLSYAEELDMITEEEKSYLRNLKKYVVYLSRVSTQENYPRDIQWPELPTQ